LGRRNAINRGGNGYTATDSSTHNNAWVGEKHLIGVLMAAQQHTASHTQLCLGRRNTFERGADGCTAPDSIAHTIMLG